MNFYMKDDHFVMQTTDKNLPISQNEAIGFRPYQLMVASIAGCSATVFKKILLKMRMDIENITINTHVERDESQRIESIHLHFILKGNDLPIEKVKKALNFAHKNCGMIQTVHQCIDVTETVEIHSI